MEITKTVRSTSRHANPSIRLLLLLLLSQAALPALKGVPIFANGDFTGSLSSWTAVGTVVNTGDAAVFSDSVPTRGSLFQSGQIPGQTGRLELSFDYLNGLSPSVPAGSFPDSFFATLYLGGSPFGPTLAGGVFDQAIGLFDLDASGAFNLASGASLESSSKGPGWTRFTFSHPTARAFSGFGTVAFEFFNLNSVGSDSVAAADNVSFEAFAASSAVPEPGGTAPLLMIALFLILLLRGRRAQAFRHLPRP